MTTDTNEQEVQIPQESNEMGQEAPKEKLVTQSDVDKAVKEAKIKGYNKGHREALEVQVASVPPSVPSPAAPIDNNAPLSADGIRQLISEEGHRQQQEMLMQQQANQVAQQFMSKMSDGPSKYEDFESVIEPLNVATMPHVVQLANDVDNTADVMYELGKNPHKLASILTLLQTSPHLAASEMNKLAGSIKKNESAAQQTQAPTPLSQVSASPTATDSGTMTLRDLKSQDWLRG